MLRSGDAVSPTAKAKKITGASVKLFKETPLARKRLQSPEGTEDFVISDSLGISCRFLAKQSVRELRLFDRAQQGSLATSSAVSLRRCRNAQLDRITKPPLSL